MSNKKPLSMKIGVTMFLAMALIFNLVPTGAFAFAENRVTGEPTAVNGSIAPSDAESPETMGKTDVTNEPVASSESTATTELSTDNSELMTSPVATEKSIESSTSAGEDGEALPFAASFAGVDFTNGGGAFTATLADATLSSQMLHVEVPFAAAGGEKYVEITLGHGLGFVGLPGMVMNGNSWSWNPSGNPLPEQMQDRVTAGAYTQAGTVLSDGTDFSYANYLPRAGTAKYSVSAGTTGLALDIPVAFDKAFAYVDGSLTLKQAVSVRVVDGGAETHAAALEDYTVTGETAMRPSGYSVRYTQAIGSSFYLDLTPGAYVVAQGDIAIGTHSKALKSYTATISLPKGIEFTGEVLPNAARGSTLSASAITVNSFDNSAPDKNTLTFTITDTDMRVAALQIGLRIAEDAVPGKEYSYTLVSQSAETLFGQTLTARVASDAPIIVPAGGDELSILALDGPPQMHSNDWDFAGDLLLLGGFRIANNTTTDITGRRLTMDFSDHLSTLGVRAARLWTGAEGAGNVVVVTTTGREIQLGNLPPVAADNSANGWTSTFSLDADLGPDEYIQTIAYDMGTIPMGNYTAVNLGNVTGPGLYYFGRLLGAPQDYDATTTLQKPDANVPGGYIDAATYTQPITVVSGTEPTIYYPAGAAFNTSTLMGGGEPGRFNFYLTSLHTYRYRNEQMRAATGFTVYLRQPDNLILSNISATWDGNTYTPQGPFTDATGTPYYRIDLPDVTLGFYDGDMQAYPRLDIYADISASAASPSFTLPLQQIFQITDTNHYEPVVNDPGHMIDNTFGFAGGVNLGTVAPNYELRVTGQQAFNVATAASRDEQSWVQYNPATDTGKVSLNTQLDAYYQVSVNNNSGTEIPSGYTVMVPIPKAGESFTSPTDGEEHSFNWPASLDGEVAGNIAATKTDANVNYTVLYATSYDALQDKDSSAWVASDAITDWDEVRGVKIVTTASLPDGFTDSFHFPLQLPEGSDAAQYAGEENIYPSVVYTASGGASGYTDSQPVCLALNTGIVEGAAYADTDHDGIVSTDDTPLSGITVRAYEAGADPATATPLETVVTDAQGAYQFTALSAEQNVDIVFSGWDASDYDVVLPTGATYEGVTPSGGNHTEKDLLLEDIYTLTYSANGGTGSMADQDLTYGESIALEENAFTREGYEFAGWATTPDGAVVYGDSESYTHETEDDVILYAVWKINTYTVSYLPGNHGDFVEDEHTGAEHFSATPAFAGDTDANGQPKGEIGYTFIGWEPEVANTVTGAAIYTAQWNPKTYTVNYDANNGIGSMTDQTATYGQDFALRPNSFSRAGYTFIGWNTEADGSGTNYANNRQFLPWLIDSNLTLFAQWKANPVTMYTVSYDANGAKGTPPASESYAEDSTVGVKDKGDLYKTGYSFKGWAVSAGGNVKYTPGDNFTITGNVVLYAVWEQDPVTLYTVTYAPGEHGTFSKRTISGLTPGAKTPSAPTVTGEEGWVFDGWSPSVSTTVTRSITYTAQWTKSPTKDSPDMFTVRFVDWDGTLLKSESVPRGGDATPPSEPTRERHSFYGWDVSYTNVRGDLTVTALYVVDFVEGGINDDGGKDDNGVSHDDVLKTLTEEEGVKAISLGGTDVPLSPGRLSNLTWALVNLILAGASAILLIIITVLYALRRKKDETEDNEEYEGEQVKDKKRRRLVWFVVGIFMGIAGVVLFFLTEDMSKLMVLADKWTMVNMAILVAEVVCSVFAFKRKNRDKEEDISDTAMQA